MLNSTHKQPRDSGFTLIELVVAMLLLLLLAGLAVNAMTNMFSGESKARSERKLQAASSTAIEQFSQDIRAMAGPGTTSWDGTRDNLRTVLAFGGTSEASHVDRGATASSCGTSISLANCMKDIVKATPTQIAFRSDVDTTHVGPECVVWVVSGHDLLRYVNNNWASCKPAGNVTKAFTFSKTFSSPFSYQLRYNPTMKPHSKSNPDNCLQKAYTPANDRQLNAIISVKINLAGHAKGRQSADNRLASVFTIQSRLANDYSFAMGCAI